MLRRLAFYFEESRPFGNKPYNRARMLVSSSLLTRRESYLTHVDGGKCFRSEMDVQERLADDRVLHESSMCFLVFWSQD